MSDIVKTLADGLRHIQITRYSHLAASTVIVFEHLITLDEEINLIWVKRYFFAVTLGLGLRLCPEQFMVAGKNSIFIGRRYAFASITAHLLTPFPSQNRYYTLAAVVFNNYSFFFPTLTDSSTFLFRSCRSFFRWQGWTGLVGCMLAEGILQIRIYALYSLNKKILAIMLICFVGCSATSAWVVWTSLSSFGASALPISGGTFCVPFGISPHFYVFWIPMLAFESLLCFLALVRGFQTFKSNGSLFHSGRQLVGILVRDSLIYFLVICATYLTCLLFWLLAPPTLLEVPVGFSVAMSCVLANRVVLNVREVSRDIDASRLNTSQKIISPTAFDASFCSPGTLTDFEMEQLRTMKAERPSSGVVSDYYEVPVPFVVL
ncbi:hypothetical protein GALMADRAFT_147830 [Galerina marginata CBS 339.88]|uniref:DUF6533 domain-containing protein n=1 Tax=Galerina marginata (strain CBS 339.88) TaxID=685588 RepID=A0A067S9I5_GALM3|nr:hypothetical protein GALMADRAFT_147830 [Galerina marginata CBS 339.88]